MATLSWWNQADQLTGHLVRLLRVRLSNSEVHMCQSRIEKLHFDESFFKRDFQWTCRQESGLGTLRE